MTSSNDGRLLTGGVRAYKDDKAKQIIVETTKFNPPGAGLEICRMGFDRAAEARAILALPHLLKDAEPFAALGRELENADGDAPLITHTAVELEMVGDVHRIAQAHARAFPPMQDVPARRGPKRRHRPG